MRFANAFVSDLEPFNCCILYVFCCCPRICSSLFCL